MGVMMTDSLKFQVVDAARQGLQFLLETSLGRTGVTGELNRFDFEAIRNGERELEIEGRRRGSDTRGTFGESLDDGSGSCQCLVGTGHHACTKGGGAQKKKKK